MSLYNVSHVNFFSNTLSSHHLIKFDYFFPAQSNGSNALKIRHSVGSCLESRSSASTTINNANSNTIINNSNINSDNINTTNVDERLSSSSGPRLQRNQSWTESDLEGQSVD